MQGIFRFSKHSKVAIRVFEITYRRNEYSFLGLGSFRVGGWS